MTPLNTDAVADALQAFINTGTPRDAIEVFRRSSDVLLSDEALALLDFEPGASRRGSPRTSDLRSAQTGDGRRARTRRGGGASHSSIRQTRNSRRWCWRS